MLVMVLVSDLDGSVLSSRWVVVGLVDWHIVILGDGVDIVVVHITLVSEGSKVDLSLVLDVGVVMELHDWLSIVDGDVLLVVFSLEED